MEFRQCLFRTVESEPDAVLIGIAVYKYGKPIGVICLCCGGWNSIKRTFILEEFDGWLDLGRYLMRAVDMADEWDDE